MHEVSVEQMDETRLRMSCLRETGSQPVTEQLFVPVLEAGNLAHFFSPI